MLLPEIAAWSARGRTISVFGQDVFVVEAGDPSAPALLLLHGYPTSSHDYAPTLDRLARHFRVVIHDHPGFGLSGKDPQWSGSLIEQAEIALGVWSQLGVTRGHVVAHDYGTSVATEIVARRERLGVPIGIDSLTLCNGSVHLELARPRLIQWLLADEQVGPWVARLSGRGLFGRNMRAILARKEVLDAGTLDTMWALLTRADGLTALPRLTRYLHERRRYHHRWIGALTRLDLPTHILWGTEDPVALRAVAEALAGEIPGARLTWLDGLGHYPMLEDPERWASEVIAFVAGIRATLPDGPRRT